MKTRNALARRWTSGALAVLLGAAVTLGMPTAASADNMNGVCESGEICIWYLQNYEGYIADMYYNEPNYDGKTFYGTSVSRNDNARSMKDMAFSNPVCLYEHANYSGHMIYNDTGSSQRADLGQWNDKASSSRFIYFNVICS